MLTFDPSKKIHEQITEETWCKGADARDGDGISVYIGSPDACAFCAYAWLMNVYGTRYDQVWKHRNHLLNTVGTAALSSWNDTPERTFAEVLAAFKAADL